jgi:hypothetical protein
MLLLVLFARGPQSVLSAFPGEFLRFPFFRIFNMHLAICAPRLVRCGHDVQTLASVLRNRGLGLLPLLGVAMPRVISWIYPDFPF